MFVTGDPDGFLDGDQFQVSWGECEYLHVNCLADVAGNAQVQVDFLNLGRFHPAGAMDRKEGGVGNNGYEIAD